MSVHLYSQSSSPLGKSTYLFDSVTAPAQFKPTLVYSAEMNKSGTNVMMKIDIDYPLLTEVDGINLAQNHFRASFSFTALRSVINDTERTRVLTELIAFLTAHKDEIGAGTVLPLPV